MTDRSSKRGEIQLLRLLRILRDFVHILPQRVRGGRELERQYVGIRQSQDGRAHRPRQRGAVGKVRVGKARVPVERVVVGVVHTGVRSLAGKARVQRGNRQEIEKCGVVGSRSQGL